MSYCQWLYRLDEGDRAAWGDQAVDLQKVARSGASVLPGFVVSKQAYSDFFSQLVLRERIERACRDLTPKKSAAFHGAALEVRELIQKTAFPHQLSQRLGAYLQHLEAQLVRGVGKGVRLVARVDDQQVSAVVHSGADLEKLLKSIYSLSFHEKALYKRISERNSILQIPFSVMIQYEEKPELSGLAYAHDPVAHDDHTICVQASHHQYAAGITTEDLYRVDRTSLALLSRKVAYQWWAEDGDGKHISPPHLGKPVQALDDTAVVKLARQIKTAQAAFPDAMQFGWNFFRNQFWITSVVAYAEPAASSAKPTIQPLLSGRMGSLGWVYGAIRLIKTKADQAKLKAGDIAVVEQVHMGDRTWLAKAKGIIAETGSEASEEGRLAKQLGIPAVVGVGEVFSKLRNGQTVTLLANHGLVYAGLQTAANLSRLPDNSDLITGTKVLATIVDPHLLSNQSLDGFDGIGLLRGEFMLRLLGVHPNHIISRKLQREYSEVLAENLELAVRAVAPRPVIYQLHDVGTAHIPGVLHERFEPNPAIGYRGAHRLLEEPELLDLEVQALTRLAKKELVSISVMMPMARSIAEVERMLAFLKNSDFAQTSDVRLWVKCETPALAILMEDLCQLDIAGVCFDVPAISQLITGFDRENLQVAQQLDQSSPAVEHTLRYAIGTCRTFGIPTMLVAEGEDIRPEIVQAAVEGGVTGISVPVERLGESRRLLASIERHMLLESLLEEGV